MTRDRPRIVVIGSINMDFVAVGKRLPTAGETVIADRFMEIPGGKGANQAVAASRAGGKVSLIGRVGDDHLGDRVVANLMREHVDCGIVARTRETSSGVALIAVDRAGENQIVVAPGANARLTPEDVRNHAELIERADVLLLQLEVPVETVLCAIEIARRKGVRVILDPAPVPDGDIPDSLLNVDLLCPNQTEAAVLTESETAHFASAEAVHEAAFKLRDLGAAAVAVTLGERGTLLCDRDKCELVSGFAVTSVDATAAGDSFAGALAVRWAETDDLMEAVRWGNAAGAIAASRPGAQPSLAQRQEIDAMLSGQPRTSKDVR